MNKVNFELGSMVIICPGCKCRAATYEASSKALITPCSKCKITPWMVPFAHLHLVDAMQYKQEEAKFPHFLPSE